MRKNFTSDEYDFISLCEVLPPDYNGIELIERYADLTRMVNLKNFTVMKVNQPHLRIGINYIGKKAHVK